MNKTNLGLNHLLSLVEKGDASFGEWSFGRSD